MIRFLYASQLGQYPDLTASMYRDRAAQFRDRLNWDVAVDGDGRERDQYDAVNPLYLIWENADGSHGASMRVLPTIGRTMTNEVFAHLNDGIAVKGPYIWECTRFCISPRQNAAAGRVAGALMLAGQELGLRFGLREAVGVYDYRMTRIYRSIGWVPKLIGVAGTGRDRICLGLWPFGVEIRDMIAQKAGLEPDLAADWFDAAFPADGEPMAA